MSSKILDRSLGKTRGVEVSLNAFSFLYSEMIQYTQKRVNGIQDLERKLADFGKHIGSTGYRIVELYVFREAKSIKRETKMLGILYFVHSTLWKIIMGKEADSLEKSNQNEDEYMITDNDPVIQKYISVPKDMSGFNCGALMAGIIEAVLECSQFHARVTAHSVSSDGFPNKTTFLIKFDRMVMERERSS